MLIRAFQQGDEAALFQVFFSAVHELASQEYTKAQRNAWAPADIDPLIWAEHMQKLKPFIAEINHQIVGYADIQPNGYIDHFYISSAYGRQGIGSQLMSHLHQQAKLQGISELTSDVSKTAQAFFISHGFEIVEHKFPLRRGLILENALMRKRLPLCEEIY
nr:GNAT family N-acetyltransferase [uncultured Moellerella sp.]